ncbi:MAG: hypothetical protein OXH15_06775 [Gammaproteobacteria bacterium]|nr:hypothetical protein [Gammaproteobacteria bacterium]
MAAPETSTARAQNWLLCGIPRAGSSLCCRLAGKVPNLVALSEPIARDRSQSAHGADAAVGLIESFVAETRTRALASGRVPTIHVEGRLDDDLVEPASPGLARLRRSRGTQGEIRVSSPLAAGFTLLVKHNALFAALLSSLTGRFECLALIRNPVAVLASWQTVDLPIGRGRIPAAEQFDKQLKAHLDRERDVLRRQMTVLNWFFGQFRAHLPAHRVIRYEDVVQSGGAVLFQALGSREMPTERLANRNDGAAYSAADPPRLLAALLDEPGAWRRFYTSTDCMAVADAIGSKA